MPVFEKEHLIKLGKIGIGRRTGHHQVTTFPQVFVTAEYHLVREFNRGVVLKRHNRVGMLYQGWVIFAQGSEADLCFECKTGDIRVPGEKFKDDVRINDRYSYKPE